jgi:hypothetical protein
MSCNIQKRRQMAATAQADLARTRDQLTSTCQKENPTANTLQTPLQKMLAEREKQDQMWNRTEEPVLQKPITKTSK